MHTIQIEFELESRHCPTAEALLEEAGALSISFLDPGGEPVLEPAVGTSPLWDTVRVLALFSGDPPADLRSSLERKLGVEALSSWQQGVLEARTWERAWMDHYHPMRFGRRLWVVPSHLEPPEPEAVNLRLDPGLAFGTGTHATTALCLDWLEGLDLKGRTVVDYGCGSGILAIAALLLGAERVYGVDNDPQALEASLENARRNGVEERLTLWAPEQVQALQADVLVANILSGVLIELQPQLRPLLAPGGRVGLSGILQRQAEDVEAAFADWVRWEPRADREGWVLLHGSAATDS